jgi:hypothetical protein
MSTFKEVVQKFMPDAIESEWHRHSNGGGWVQNTAHVDAKAYVGPSARVCGDASVYGSARVCGGKWDKSPINMQLHPYAVTNSAPGMVSIGCQSHTIKNWLMNGHEVAKEFNLTEAQIELYKAAIEFIAKFGK